eukprot:TRINITY_DN2295_c0_g1_i4.p1 TRINITY_DN2295_c0_g1~~TRINITY_DN2295_c0_g1_i4.p1  ORF type:complete len:499 (+),score=92.02 TRINITY_DN2295_c0_g1_i4:73-1569(+)
MATKEDILQKICVQRRIDISDAKKQKSLEELKEQIKFCEFTPLNIISKIEGQMTSNKLCVLAEVKRASPSKGDIAVNKDAVKQAILYARAGSLEDLRSIRKGIESFKQRPALLRKDFILDAYQIYEARLCGADSVLLIVAILTKDVLHDLILVSRSLGMEPLVEVNNNQEMDVALEVGAKFIGINNRNLRTFEVDPKTTEKVISGRNLDGIIIAALSGISCRKDVTELPSKVRAILVGEALMVASNPVNKIKELLGEKIVYVKVCGLMNIESTMAAVEAGADMIGLMFAESKRKLSVEKAKEIVSAIHKWRNEKQRPKINLENHTMERWFFDAKEKYIELMNSLSPLIVGVFADNEVEYINTIAEQVDLDLIQLSGHEGFDVIKKLNRLTIKAVHIGHESPEVIVEHIKPIPLGILLDTSDPNVRGGTGKTFDWGIAQKISKRIPFILAGGLNSDNVQQGVVQSSAYAVDVSSGVETDGQKDIRKIQDFIKNAKTLHY